jgi:GNAT superfamily N-acetyltransferase
MDYPIINATSDDLPLIFRLFEEAILYQQKNNYTGWNTYDKDFIRTDIQQGLLYKILDQDDIVCIFSICLRDALIWREKENNDALYLHRLVLDRQFKKEKVFQLVLDWAIRFALNRGLKYIRMDTWATNRKLIDYYKSYGFVFIEDYTTVDTADLPEQHRNLHVSLLEFVVPTTRHDQQVQNKT